MALTPHARRIVELAREERTPSEEDLARVEARLALGLGVAAASSIAVAQVAKGGIAGKAGAAVAAFKWWIAGSGLLVAAVASHAVMSAAPARIARPVRPSVSVAASRPAAVAAVAPVPVMVAPTGASRVEPAASASLAQAQVQAQVQKRAARAGERRPRTSSDSMAADVELLHAAQVAWRERDASAALSLLREHRVRFARSSLRLERDALQVLALCELGRKAEAARIARGLLVRAPRSPLRASIEESCALK